MIRHNWGLLFFGKDAAVGSHTPSRKVRCTSLLTLLLLLSLAAPTYAQSPASDRIGVVRGQGSQLLDESTRQSAANLPAGALLIVKGRSPDSSLLYVQTETQQVGWVSAASLLVINLAALPVIDLPTAAPPEQSVTPASEDAPAVKTAQALTTTPPALTPLLPITTTNAGSDTITATVTLQTSRLNLRAGPGADYPIVSKAEPNSQWQVIGRNQAGDWLQLRGADGQPMWAVATYLQVSEPVAVLSIATELPTVSAPIALLPTPTPRPSTSTAAPVVAAPVVAADLPRANKTGLSGTLAFQDRIGGTIYTYHLNSDTLRPLTNGIDPAISPDGRQVAFVRDGGGRGLFVINVDGTGERRLYNDQELVRSPKWSPDGRWIAFSRSSGFEDCRLLDGGVCVPDERIVESLPEDLQLPDIQVGKLIGDLPNQREYQFVLARIGVDGADYRDLPSREAALAPDWSDGGIVYQSRSGIQRTADKPDAESVQVANDNLHGYFHDPDLQPGGGRIVFHRKQGSHWQVYAMNGDGSGIVALTRPVTALVDELPSNVAPAWSPNGQTIIYLSNRNSIESAGAWHLWAMNADGSNQRQLPIDIAFDYSFSSEQVVSWGN